MLIKLPSTQLTCRLLRDIQQIYIQRNVHNYNYTSITRCVWCVNVRRPVAKKLVTIKDQLYGQVAQSHRAAVVKKMESLKIILFLGLAGTASGS